MNVGFHLTEGEHPKYKDGANFAYDRICKILNSSQELSIQPHDFRKLLESSEYAYARLKDLRVVVSTVGPHAHYYFLLRELLDLDFRIIRDIRTAIWSGYLFQEVHCKPLSRVSDVTIHSSAYSLAMCEKLLSHPSSDHKVICYPIMDDLPREYRSRWMEHKREHVVLGAVGRVTNDKGLGDLIRLSEALDNKFPNKYKIIALGELSEDILQCNLHNNDVLELRSQIPRSELWEFYLSLDCILFFSSSNLETFGRVIAEAVHVGVPILASKHAATTELLSEEDLINVKPRDGLVFPLSENHPLAKIQIDEAIERIANLTNSSPSRRKLDAYNDDVSLFRSIVYNWIPDDYDWTRCKTNSYQELEIDRVRLTKALPVYSRKDAIATIERIRDRFLAITNPIPELRMADYQEYLKRYGIAQLPDRLISDVLAGEIGYSYIGVLDRYLYMTGDFQSDVVIS